MPADKRELTVKEVLIGLLCFIFTLALSQGALSATPTNPGIEASCVSATCHKGTTHENHSFYSDCAVCHFNPQAEFRASLAFKLNCSGCHNQAHNQTLSCQVPVQIPLFEGFEWSTPAPYLTWKGDDWTLRNGTVYDQRMMIFSNSRKDVDLNTVLQWYKTALANNGWTVQSSNIYVGTDYFKIHSNIGTEMRVTVWMYKNATYGWAIRILYGAYSTV